MGMTTWWRRVTGRDYPTDTAALAGAVSADETTASATPPAEPQTARVGQLRREWDEHPARGITPARLHSLLERAERGDLTAQTELADDMLERDAHLAAEISKRVGAVTSLPYSIEPPENATPEEKSLTDEVRDWVSGLTAQGINDDEVGGAEQIISNMCDGILKGFAAQEQVWRYVPDGSGRKVQLPHLRLQPTRWFTTTPDRRGLLLRDQQMTGGDEDLAPVMGQPLQPLAWLMHMHPARNGYLARMNLARVLFWPYLFKNYAVRDLAEFLEIYGIPPRIGFFPTGASDQEKAKLLQAVTSIGHNAAGVMPQSMKLEFMAAAAGTHDPFVAMWDRMDAAESKAILGQTLSASEGNKGSHALGQVHEQVRMDIRSADVWRVSSTFRNQLIHQLVLVNKGPMDPRRLPCLKLDDGEPEDLQLYADNLPKLAAAGVQVPVQWVHEKLRIPEPKDGEAVLSAPPPPAPPGGDPNAPPGGDPKAQPPGGKMKKAALAGQLPTDGGRDAIDNLVDEAIGDWRPLLQPMVAPLMAQLRDAVAAGESLESFRDRLPALIEGMDAGALGLRLAQAAFKARLEGEAGQ